MEWWTLNNKLLWNNHKVNINCYFWKFLLCRFYQSNLFSTATLPLRPLLQECWSDKMKWVGVERYCRISAIGHNADKMIFAILAHFHSFIFSVHIFKKKTLLAPAHSEKCGHIRKRCYLHKLLVLIKNCSIFVICWCDKEEQLVVTASKL